MRVTDDMERKRVTIYDIAKATDVSASTVTRALNGQKGVGDKMRDTIIAKASEMGYRTNLIANFSYFLEIIFQGTRNY